jgi:hypothetical protein
MKIQFQPTITQCSIIRQIKVFTTAFLNQLLAWHNQDPVSAREIARNNAIYARQNNRNPYIDHPEYVASVWTTERVDTQAPTAPTNLMVTTHQTPRRYHGQQLQIMLQ